VDTSNTFGQHEFVLSKVSISINVPDTTSYKLLSSHSSSADPMANCALNVQVLQASVDPDDESHFRILVGGKFIKYLTVDTGLYSLDDMCFAPSLILLLPSLPPGDWNVGHISKDPTHGRPYFATATKIPLRKITHIWHPSQIDHLELEMGQKLRSNVYETTSPRFNSTIIAKFARFSWEIPSLDSETAAYEWINGHQIGPEFLGHLIEEGRVIGFLMERVLDCRHAMPEDLPLCQHALTKLHRLGIKHGDINKHNFLIRNGEAVLIDFDYAERCDNPKFLAEEFQMLEQQLWDDSGRGGSIMS
jgi:predicted Ser/Thr protein kinase